MKYYVLILIRRRRKNRLKRGSGNWVRNTFSDIPAVQRNRFGVRRRRRPEICNPVVGDRCHRRRICSRAMPQPENVAARDSILPAMHFRILLERWVYQLRTAVTDDFVGNPQFPDAVCSARTGHSCSKWMAAMHAVVHCDCKRTATTARNSTGCRRKVPAVYSRSDCKWAVARADSDGVGSDDRRCIREAVRSCCAGCNDCCDVTAVTYCDCSHPRCRRDSWARSQRRHRDCGRSQCLGDASPCPDDANDQIS